MEDPRLLWTPSEEFVKDSNLSEYRHWLIENRNLNFDSYSELWTWSTENIEDFWESLWQYFEIIHSTDYHRVLSKDAMPRTRWFEGSMLNYSEHIFRNSTPDFPAIIFKTEDREQIEVSWKELEQKVAGLRSYLISAGIKKGDRIAAWLPNIPEAIIGFLATNSLGAVWSSTSPDFGTSSVIDRFSQIKPKLLIVADGYRYGGKEFDKKEGIIDLIDQLPTLSETLVVDFTGKTRLLVESSKNISSWDQAVSTQAELSFDHVPFEHPLWILYSSGTTGLPKAITHSHGGALMEHCKYLSFHNDVKPGERFFWYSTTGWMMWNYTVASLLCGSTVVLYEGSPAYPNLNVLWKLAADASINHFGTSAPFIIANMKKGLSPGKEYDLTSLRSLGSTGAPLPPDGFDWIYANIKNDLWLASISGGTDVCSAFVGGNPWWPVYSGEIQCRALGCKLEAYDATGKSIVGEVGEMVISKPMPSMPIFFWNDPDFARYEASYFEMFPGKWRHGDWISVTEREGVVIYGRSDATLNRGGVRIGTAEIYRVLDRMSEVEDALIVCLDKEGGEFFMPLFVVLPSGVVLDEKLRKLLNQTIRDQCTPRHVPDKIIQIEEIPYTISGKKTEAPVKKILMGIDVSNSLNRDALKNPSSLNIFIELSEEFSKS